MVTVFMEAVMSSAKHKGVTYRQLLLLFVFGFLITLESMVRLLGISAPDAFHAIVSIAIFSMALALATAYLERIKRYARPR